MTASSVQGGLVGSSTPFHSATHIPFTLFFGRDMVSTGAVGLAVIEPNYTQPTAAKLSYGSLKAMGKPFEVTRCACALLRLAPVLTDSHAQLARQHCPHAFESERRAAAARSRQRAVWHLCAEPLGRAAE